MFPISQMQRWRKWCYFYSSIDSCTSFNRDEWIYWLNLSLLMFSSISELADFIRSAFAILPIRQIGSILQDFDHPADEKKYNIVQKKKHPLDGAFYRIFHRLRNNFFCGSILKPKTKVFAHTIQRMALLNSSIQ